MNWLPLTLDVDNCYEVSDTGQIRSSRYRTGRSLKGSIGSRGYRVYVLRKQGSDKLVLAHRAVASAFIPNPENKPQVNHKDGNKKNNHVDNLEWCTAKENTEHALRLGLANRARGQRTRTAKITEKLVEEIRRRYADGEKQKSLAEAYKLSQASISFIVNHINWAHVS